MKTILDFLKKWKLIFCVLLALIAALLVVLKANIRVLRENSDNRGSIDYDLTGAKLNGFTLTDVGLVLDENVNYENTNGDERTALIMEITEALTGDTADVNKAFDEKYKYSSITLENNGSYVHKLKYEYEATGRVEVLIVTINETDGTQAVTGVYQDYNNQFTNASVHTVRNNCTKVKLIFLVANDLTVTGVSRVNAPSFNWIKFFAVAACVFSVLFLLTSVDWINTRLENIFVVLAMLMGLAFIFAIPQQKNGWDECYHFEQAYTLFNHSGVGEAVETYMDDTAVWPLNSPQTYEEYGIQNSAVNAAAVGTEKVDGSFSLSKLLGYLAPAIGIKLATLFGLPFTVVFKIGKIFSLMLYVIIVYFAIKRMNVGKTLLTVTALLPTAIYMNCIYNRDSVMLACAFLATAYLFSIFYEEDALLDWKSFGIIMGSLFVVCLLKVVYAPMLLIIFLLPKNKFADGKQRRWMMLGMLAVCFLLVAVLILPRLIGSGAGGGDQRGLALVGEGAVIDSVSQLKFILTHPRTYFSLLRYAIDSTFMDYTFGVGVWGTLGHNETTVPYTDEVVILLLILALTDTGNRKQDISLIRRIGIFALLAAAVVLVWTSMYMAYSAVGANSIQGVQARYYLPVLLPFFMLFNTAKIHTDFNVVWYRKLMVLAAVLVSYWGLYNVILVPYCS